MEGWDIRRWWFRRRRLRTGLVQIGVVQDMAEGMSPSLFMAADPTTDSTTDITRRMPIRMEFRQPFRVSFPVSTTAPSTTLTRFLRTLRVLQIQVLLHPLPFRKIRSFIPNLTSSSLHLILSVFWFRLHLGLQRRMCWHVTASRGEVSGLAGRKPYTSLDL